MCVNGRPPKDRSTTAFRPTMVDMFPSATDMDMPFQLMDRLLPEFPMVDMLLPAMDLPLPELPMVDMLILAMGMDIILLATDIDMVLPELPMVDMLLLAMDILLLATDMDNMLLSTTDRSSIGKDMDGNKFASSPDHTLLLLR